MSWAARTARNLRALVHYRPRQIAHRGLILARRRLASVVPDYLERRVFRIEQAPPAARDLRCVPALPAFALDESVCAPEAAEEMLEGRFTFLAETHDLGERPAWNARGPDAPSHLWRMNLHYHRFLVNAVAGALRRPAMAHLFLRRAAFLLDHWRSSCPPGREDGWQDAWSSYAVSTRLLNAWMARLLVERVDTAEASLLKKRLEALGAGSALFLSHWLERDLEGNHLLRNACALVAAGQWFGGPTGENWSELGRRLLQRELGRQILVDGFHEERSPMYHSLLIEDLLMGAFGQGAGSPSGVLKAWVSKLLAALKCVLHPDGQIALLNDSALGVAAAPAALYSVAENLGIQLDPASPADLPAAGYYRLHEGACVLLFDAGSLGPDHLPAHAHCDALSFELSVDGHRLVTDTGVDRYEAGAERDFQRSTAAHSTLQVQGLEQGEPFGSFRMGRRPRVRGRRVDGPAAEGEHDGFGSAGVHRRLVRWLGASKLEWSDRLEGDREVSVVVRLGLAPAASIHLVARNAAVVQAPRAGSWRFEGPPDGTLSCETGVYCERFGIRTPREVLCWSGISGRGRAHPFSLVRVG